MTSYYDIVLGLIPLALLGIAGALVAIGVQLLVAVPAAALVSVGLIGHALFVNGPTETGAPTATAVPEQPSRTAD
jgi:hypothetical protein